LPIDVFENIAEVAGGKMGFPNRENFRNISFIMALQV